MLEKLKELPASRKFWAAVVGSILVVINDQMGRPLDNVQMGTIAGLFASWIIGQAQIDASNNK